MKKLVLIPILALLLAACGGEDKGKRFADDVNTIQTQAANRINASLASGNEDQIRRVASAEFNRAATRIANLKKLPEGAGDERDALVDTLRAGAQAAAQADGAAGVRSLSATAAQVSEEIKDLNGAF